MLQPSWQAEVLVDIGNLYNRKHYPKLTWRVGSNRLSSGHYNRKRKTIVITAGKEGSDHTPVLLHELAHWLTPKARSHGRRFWQVAFKLFERYGITKTNEDYVQRELKYMKMASTVYQELYG